MQEKQKEFIQTLSFFGIAIASIVGLISYLWVYTEIDETLIAIELQKATREELNNSIKDLQDDIAYLGRVDRVTDKARKELGMVLQHQKLSLSILIQIIWHLADDKKLSKVSLKNISGNIFDFIFLDRVINQVIPSTSY